MIPLTDPEILVFGDAGLVVWENADDMKTNKKEKAKKFLMFIVTPWLYYSLQFIIQLLK
jgi:hypothetical protein